VGFRPLGVFDRQAQYNKNSGGSGDADAWEKEASRLAVKRSALALSLAGCGIMASVRGSSASQFMGYPELPDGRRLVYIAHNENMEAISRLLRQQMPPVDFQKTELRALPGNLADIRIPGLLYLPRP
jgi:hypothetical protein